MKLAAALISVCLSLPVAFYLQYQVLVRVQATELMMFLFWVNLPFIVFSGIVSRLVEKDGK